MKISLLIFLLISSVTLNATTIINGLVKDDYGAPIAFATISVINIFKNVSIGYAITKNDGSFSFSINTNEDSVILKISAVGYANRNLIVKNESANIGILKLTKAAVDLPTIVIEEKVIQLKGDTLTYNVAAFTGKSDNKIGDVIKNLPGVEMSATGQISFNGKPISHYYIDGLDMLGGQYNIANVNIPADLVAKVEILQNHQDKKILDGIKRGEEPALNLKLKSKAKNKFLASASIAAGVTPLLFEEEITALNFRPEKQFIGSLKNNNTGKALKNETEHKITVSAQGDTKINIEAPNPIPTLPLNLPDIQAQRFTNNSSTLIHLSGIKAPKKKAQITYNASWLNEFNRYNQIASTTFFLANGNDISFIEKTVANTNTNNFSGRLGILINNGRKFIKNTFEPRIILSQENYDINNVGRNVQKLRTPKFSLFNEYIQLIPWGKKLLSFKSISSYAQIAQQLSIIPGQFDSLLNNRIPYTLLKQDGTLKNIKSENSISVIKKIGKQYFDFAVSAALDHQNLNSAIFIDDKIPVMGNDSFTNSLKFQNVSLGAEASTTYILKKYALFLKAPVTYNIVSAKDESKNYFRQKHAVFLNPYVNLSYKVKEDLDFDLTYQNTNWYGIYLQQAQGYIISNYRNIKRSQSDIPLNKMNSLNASIHLKKPLSAFFATLNLAASHTSRNLITNVLYNQFTSTEVALPIKNNDQTFTSSLNISKYLIKEKISIKANFINSNFKTPLFQNATLLKNRGKSESINLQLAYRKIKKLNFSIGTQFSHFKTNTFEASKLVGQTKFTTLKQTAEVYFDFTNSVTIWSNAEWYKVKVKNNEAFDYVFLNVGINKKLKSKTLSLSCTNLTNNREYRFVTAFQNVQNQVAFSLRPINILARINFSL